MKISKYIKIIILFFAIFACCFARIAQQKKHTYFIKKETIVDKPVSPQAGWNMIDLNPN